jgi:hypothetical protein
VDEAPGLVDHAHGAGDRGALHQTRRV